MSSITMDDSVLNKLLNYESIFKHYGIENLKRDFETKNNVFERNENNKTKKINAKTITKKSNKTAAKHSPPKSKHNKKPETKTKHHEKLLKITVPNVGKTRKASHTSKHESNQLSKISRTASPTPVIELHTPSDSTMKTTHTVPTFHSQTDHSVSSIQPNNNQLVPPTVSFHQSDIDKSVSIANQTTDETNSILDVDESNRFIRETFKFSGGDHSKTKIYRHQIRLNCPKDQDDDLEKYAKSRTYCVDIFEEYVLSLKRQHGIIRDAASDPPTFEPGISITGPQVRKEPSVIDKEDALAIKKMSKLESRKKYALVHEDIGIFIIGGYNLFVDIPIQKEPQTEYLFKFDGSTVKIPPLTPGRVHFAIYADSNTIYIAGGQTIHNELLDDIQCLNLKTFRWEHITTLINPIAACGMTLDDNRLYLVGGYDIVQNQTSFLPDFMIYNLHTGKFEKSTNLPAPRCRSLVFATNNSIFCISGLVEGHNENKNKKIKISTDILKWSKEMPQWNKVSQTPELTKLHALSFNDPYLEITKRILDDKGDEIDTIVEAFFDFRSNTWTNGKALKSPTSMKSEVTPQTPSKSNASLSPKSLKTPSKSKIKSKKHK